MNGKVKCVIDIGTNSIKFLLGSLVDGEIKIIRDFGVVTGLGREIRINGAISSGVICETGRIIEEVFKKHPEIAVSDKLAIATEALRSAKNKEEISDKLSKIISSPVTIISAAEEIDYCVKSIKFFHGLDRALVIDLGGGSLDLAEWSGDSINKTFSFPIGMLFLHSELVNSDPPTPDEIDRVRERVLNHLLSADSFSTSGTIVTIGATARIISNLTMAHKDEKTGLKVVFTAKLKPIVRTLLMKRSDDISREYNIDLSRSKLLSVGATIYMTIMEFLRAESFCVSRYGLRHGVLLKEFKI